MLDSVRSAIQLHINNFRSTIVNVSTVSLRCAIIQKKNIDFRNLKTICGTSKTKIMMQGRCWQN